MLTLREWRRAKEVSVERLAGAIGVSPSTVNNWENKGQKMPVKYAVLICDFLGIRLEDVNFFTDE